MRLYDFPTLNADDAVYRGVPALFGTAATYLIGNNFEMLSILGVLIVVDYVTGATCAYLRQELSSEQSIRGIAKKLASIALLILAHMLDVLLDQGFPVVQTAALWLLIANEGISITENLAELGVPIPTVMRDALAKLNHDADEAKAVPDAAE